MMKRKVLVLCLTLLAALLLGICCASAESDPIVCEMELSPDKLTGPGTINVTITVSNSSDEDMRDPVVLYDPAAKIVSDFGSNGAAVLKAGESKTWTGTYDVNQRTLENGVVVYFVKYTIYKDSGEAVAKSQPIRKEIALQTAEADLSVSRTISPTIAREGQEVVVKYDISNTGTVSLLDVTLQETKDIHKDKQTVPELKPGQTVEIKYTVTMGKKDLTSGGTITYKTEADGKAETYTVENKTITFGESSLEAKLTSSAKGVPINDKLTLTLELKNSGSVDYSDLRVTDPTLGDVFTNQKLEAGKSLKLEKEVTLPETMDFQFTVTAIDATGTENTVATEAVTVMAVDPADALTLTVTATPNRTEVFEQPGMVRFTIEVANNSNVDAKNVKIMHGDTTIYTYESLPAGASRKLSRDTALSMAGKYRFTVSAVDPLENTLTFQSNEMQIAFSVPTPAPATPTPAPDPTPEPTFSPVTMPPINDPSIGTVPKAINTVVVPITVVAGVLLLASCVLLIIATGRRRAQRKASEAAVDQLERAKRRDYVSPAEPQEPVESDKKKAKPDAGQPKETAAPSAEEELPHMKYARSAAMREESGEKPYTAMNSGLYDEDITSVVDYGGGEVVAPEVSASEMPTEHVDHDETPQHPIYDKEVYAHPADEKRTYTAEKGSGAAVKYVPNPPAAEEPEAELPRRRSRRDRDTDA